MRPATNRPAPPGPTGSASISGPHMAAQCKLPSNPSAKAIPKSILFSSDGDFLFEEKFSPAGIPFGAHQPQARGKLGNIQRLRAVGFWFQLKFPVQPRFRRTVEFNRAGKLLCKLRGRQCDDDGAAAGIPSDGRAGFLGAGGAVYLALEFQFLLVVIGVDQMVAVRRSDDDDARHAGKKQSERSEDAQWPEVASGFHNFNFAGR